MNGQRRCLNMVSGISMSVLAQAEAPERWFSLFAKITLVRGIIWVTILIGCNQGSAKSSAEHCSDH